MNVVVGPSNPALATLTHSGSLGTCLGPANWDPSNGRCRSLKLAPCAWCVCFVSELRPLPDILGLILGYLEALCLKKRKEMPAGQNWETHSHLYLVNQPIWFACLVALLIETGYQCIKSLKACPRATAVPASVFTVPCKCRLQNMVSVYKTDTTVFNGSQWAVMVNTCRVILFLNAALCFLFSSSNSSRSVWKRLRWLVLALKLNYPCAL